MREIPSSVKYDLNFPSFARYGRIMYNSHSGKFLFGPQRCRVVVWAVYSFRLMVILTMCQCYFGYPGTWIDSKIVKRPAKSGGIWGWATE